MRDQAWLDMIPALALLNRMAPRWRGWRLVSGAVSAKARRCRVGPFGALVSALLLPGPLSGCGGGDDPATKSSPTSVALANANNYGSNSRLSIPTVATASATDLDICWSNVVSDLQCHPLAPEADLDTVALLRFLHLSQAEVEAKLTAGQLAQSEVDGYLEYTTDHASSCTKLSNMSFFGTKIEIQEQYVESDEHTYMLVFTEGTTPGVGARSMMFVRPSSSSNNTRVDAQTGCGLLDFSANLSAAEPVRVPRAGPWVIDWRNLTRDGQGNPIAFESIDSVMLGFFAGMSVADLERQILDLELLATSLWDLELSGGRTADLARARLREGGAAFTGFEREEDGVWVLGLMCTTCQNPAPVVLSVLEPVAGDAP
jgi:hypothetical protein